MSGEHYIYLACACGHAAESRLDDWPADLRGEAHLKPETLDRLKCSACGRRGRPRATICGWTNGWGGGH